MNDLKRKYEEFLNMRFPHNNDVALENLFMELAELDTGIAGVISSYIKNKKIKYPHIIIQSKIFNEKINNWLDKENKDYISMKKYWEHLYMLIIIMEEIQK